MKAFRTACRSNDAARARRSLQRWLRRHGPLPGDSLLEFAAAADDPRLAAAIRELDRCGFSAASGPWQGEELWSSFDQWRRRRDSRPGSGPADPTDLYAPGNRTG